MSVLIIRKLIRLKKNFLHVLCGLLILALAGTSCCMEKADETQEYILFLIIITFGPNIICNGNWVVKERPK